MHYLTPANTPQTPFILALFALLTVLGGLLLAGEIVVSPALAWVSCVYYAALCRVAMRYYPAAFLLLLWFVFLRATSMISGALIENGAFMLEILQQGEATGAFARLSLIYTIAILGGVWMIDKCLKYCPTPPRDQDIRVASWAYVAIILTLMSCAGMIALGLQHGFPLLDGIDRFTYRKIVDSRFLEAFLSNRMIIAVLLGMIFVVCRGAKKTLAVIAFVLLMVMSFLIAEKFTSISMMVIYFITPLFLMKASALKDMSRYIIALGFVITVITIPAVLLVYGLDKNPQAAFEKLSMRAASQAQIWYLADQETDALLKFDTARIDYNIKSLVARDPDALRKASPYIGARDFMAQYLDKSRYINYIDKGVSLTLGMEGYLTKMLGYLGMIPVYMLVIAVYCAQLSYLAYGITSANPLRVILAAKLLIWSDYGLKQGYLYSMIGLKSCLLMLIAIGFEIGIRMIIKRRRAPEIKI